MHFPFTKIVSVDECVERVAVAFFTTLIVPAASRLVLWKRVKTILLELRFINRNNIVKMFKGTIN